MPDAPDESRAPHRGSLAQLFEEAPEALVLLDAASGRVLEANVAAAALYGCTRVELAGLTALDLSAGHASGQWPAGAAGAGEAGAGPYRHRRADGTEFPAEVSSSVVTWRGAPAVLHTVRDASGLLAGRMTAKAAGERLRHAVEERDDLYNRAPVGYHTVDASGLVVAVNDTELAWLGYERDGVVGLRRFTEFLAGESRDRFEQALATWTAHGWVHDLELTALRRDGSTFPVRLESTAVYDEDGTFERVLGVLIDVSTERQAADERRESEDRRRALFEHLPHGVIYADRQGRILAANPAAERFFGLSAADLAGRSLDDPRWKVVRGDGSDFPAAERAVMPALRTGVTVHDVEFGVYNGVDHTYRWARVTAVPEFRPGETEPSGVLATFDDITQRHRSEIELRESEARYRAMFAENRAIKLLIDPATGEIVDANPAAEDFYGYTREQLCSLRISDINTLSVPEVKAEMDTAAGGPTVNFAFRHRLASGEVRDVEVNSGPLVVAGRKLLFSIIQDVTERRLAEEQVRRHAEQLRRALEGTVLAVSQVTESRDPYTAGHERRVSELAVAIARHLAWDEDDVEGLRIAAILHDIGKVAVPVEILTRPGRLGAAEFELIRQHAQEGHDILAGIAFEWPVAEMVLQHHERLDGSGYPRGITAGDILPGARILAVADVVEAMSSHRPYRPSLGMAAALDEVRRGAGTLFDAGVVEACEAVCASGFAFGD